MKYLLLSLGEKTCRIFHYDGAQLICIKTIEADIVPSSGSLLEGVQKDALLHIFMHEVEDELALLLKEHPLSVVVTGKSPLLRRFRNLTANKKSIESYIPMATEDPNKEELAKLIGTPLINESASPSPARYAR